MIKSAIIAARPDTWYGNDSEDHSGSQSKSTKHANNGNKPRNKV